MRKSIANYRFAILLLGYTTASSLYSSETSANTDTIITEQATIVKEALQLLKAEERRQEDLIFDSIPDLFDCNKTPWVKNCSSIIRYAKQHPEAPIRLYSKTGKEIIIQPGTPRSFVQVMLDPTADNAEAVVDYMDDLNRNAQLSAQLYKDRLLARGGLESVRTIDEIEQDRRSPKKGIETDQLKISTFIKSDCIYCKRQLGLLAKLQARYPSLQIRIYQLDNNPNAFHQLVTSSGLKGRVLNAEDISKVRAKGIVRWPITWIDNTKKKQRRSLIGVKNITVLEHEMLAMSKIEVNK